jgi:FkbM family methyltransferase
MPINSWKAYIHNKYRFYDRHAGQRRIDPEFTWEMMGGGRKATVRSFLKRMPPIYALHRSLSKSEDKWSRFEREADQMFEVRCLLNDELSQVLYDEAIILRMVGHEKFFYPRHNFEPLVNLVASERFLETGYPDNYLGVPLERVVLSLNDGANRGTVKVVAASGFVDLLNNWRQYFVAHGRMQFTPKEGDVVFDCGACIGDITTVLAGFVGENGQVHAFDPIPLHNKFTSLQARLNPELSKAFFINQLAVGKTSAVRTGAQSDVNQISPGGLQIDSFEMCSLDDYFRDRQLSSVNMIKMDIEGAETDALSGAENIIREFKPKLAISIYHRPEDFWSLPLQIKKLNPKYRFGFGHHSPVQWESVIYAYEETGQLN